MNIIELFNLIKNNNVAKVKETLAKTPKFLNEYCYGVTPLLYSIESNSESIALELCLNPHVDLSCKTNEDESVLMKAIEHKMYKIMEIVCRKANKSMLNELLDSGETYLTHTLKSDDSNASIALINGTLLNI